MRVRTDAYAVSSQDKPEVTAAGGTSTINWPNSVIDKVTNDRAGDDTINGNPAANFISSRGAGKDDIYGGGGNDRIFVSEGSGGDFVNCGGLSFNPDNDTVFYDGPTATDLGDIVRKCENKTAF